MTKDNISKSQECTTNIGPKQRRKRLFMGLTVHAITIVLSAVFIHYHLGLWWKSALFIPFFMGFLGLIQAQKKVCVMYAQQSTRNMDNGTEKIEDESIADEIRKKAKKIYLVSLLSSIFMTIVIMAI